MKQHWQWSYAVVLMAVVTCIAFMTTAQGRTRRTSSNSIVVRCCIPQDDQGEQEGDQGEQEGEQGDDGEPPECEQLTLAECSEEGGTAIGPGSCDPNPCAASPSGAFLNTSGALF